VLRIQYLMAAAILWTTAATAGAQPGQPSQGWAVAEADGACTMRHGLEGVQGGALEVRTYAGTGQYQLRLVSQDWRWEPRNGEDMVSLFFVPGRAQVSTYVVASFLREGGREIYVLPPVPPVFVERIAQSSHARLVVLGEEAAIFPLTDGTAARRELLACQRRKLIEWGADPAVFGTGATPARPTGDPSEWMSGYVSGGLTDRNFAVLALKVGANGRPEGCTIVDTNHPRYASFMCRRLRTRGRYEPARDARGNPVRSVAVYWRDNRTFFQTGIGDFYS